MSLPADTPPAVTDVLGYLQHHLQELTERQNASEHIINNTLAGLSAQIQQLTQLMTGPAPAPTVAPPPLTTSPLLSTLLPRSRPPRPNSGRGQNSLLCLTSLVNELLVKSS